ncbi:hypothetical protein [Tropicibacter oceani]|uniref:Uncharacterized protein n=1 Tax=Tropicibacter oceani TaxID=3058420 RepID=A0ABY8QKP3_9RHOB|nr:hypothetical protein [Tropicibacter oceani]WGW05194.1 hypothetical protein QF118_06525 [Tropicibacter oceani]WGW05195.1 hypothetical protein QF118_06530 [Tropicibacter oceani]
MKRIIASSLVAIAAFAGAAQAMTSTPTAAQLHEIQTFAPQADLSGLSATEVNSILAVIHSGDSAGETRGKVLAMIK